MFKHAEYHTTLIRTLAKKPFGMTRTALIQEGRLADSGRITQVLTELAESGFITAYASFGKKKKGKVTVKK